MSNRFHTKKQMNTIPNYPVMRVAGKYFQSPKNRQLIFGNPDMKSDRNVEFCILGAGLALGVLAICIAMSIGGGAAVFLAVLLALALLIFTVFMIQRILRGKENAPIYSVPALCMDVTPQSVMVLYWDYLERKFQLGGVRDRHTVKFQKGDVITIHIKEEKNITLEGLPAKQEPFRFEVLVKEASQKQPMKDELAESILKKPMYEQKIQEILNKHEKEV